MHVHVCLHFLLHQLFVYFTMISILYKTTIFIQAKKVTRFVSTVKVLESNFQTFPNSFPTKEQAEEAAAAMAIAKLDISSHTNSTNNNR